MKTGNFGVAGKLSRVSAMGGALVASLLVFLGAGSAVAQTTPTTASTVPVTTVKPAAAAEPAVAADTGPSGGSGASTTAGKAKSSSNSGAQSNSNAQSGDTGGSVNSTNLNVVGGGGGTNGTNALVTTADAGNLGNYLHFTAAAGTTTIEVSSTGGFSGGYNSAAVDQVITVSGVNLVGSLNSDAAVIADLFQRGKLVTDGH